jgi:hypothetical protein
MLLAPSPSRQGPEGATGVLITGGPTAGIIWLWHGLTFDVYGPIDTFSDASARVVANSD